MSLTLSTLLAFALTQGQSPLQNNRQVLGEDYWETVSFIMPTEKVAPPFRRDDEDKTRSVHTKKSLNLTKLSETYEVMSKRGSPLLVLIDKEYGPLRHWKETAKLLKQAKENDFLIPISQLSDTMFRRLEQYIRPIANADEASVLVDASQAISISIAGKSFDILPQSTSTKEATEKLAKVDIKFGEKTSRPNLKDVIPDVDMAYRVRPYSYGYEVETAQRLEELLVRESNVLESIIDSLLPNGSGKKSEARLGELPGEQRSTLIEKLKNEVRMGNLTDLQVEEYLANNPVVRIQQFVTMVASTGERSRYQVPLYYSYRKALK